MGQFVIDANVRIKFNSNNGNVKHTVDCVKK